jgi:hypothetical protein
MSSRNVVKLLCSWLEIPTASASLHKAFCVSERARHVSEERETHVGIGREKEEELLRVSQLLRPRRSQVKGQFLENYTVSFFGLGHSLKEQFLETTRSRLQVSFFSNKNPKVRKTVNR